MKTIRQRLTRRLLWVWSGLLIVGALAAYWIARQALTRQFDEALDTRAMAVEATVEQNNGTVSLDEDDQLLRDFETGRDPAFYQLWQPDGTVIARSPSLREANLPWHGNSSSKPEFANVRLAAGGGYRAVSVRFRPQPADDANVPSDPVEAILTVAASRRALDQTLDVLVLVLVGFGVLVIALTATTVPRLLRRELAPLNHLADRAQRITAESLAERFPTSGLPGELAPISARLNALLQRLQDSFERERRFSDDLAHEFRTPIAELRSLAELSLKWPDARVADTDRHVLSIAVQMESTINRLLAIARNEGATVSVDLHRVDLSSAVTALCSQLESRASRRQSSFRVSVPANLEVQADPVLLRSIVTNLMDNAVEYSPAGSSVEIEAEEQNGRFILSVTNPVQHLGNEDVPHLFERFWRKDAARSGSGHSGLGLPLARAFASTLGWTLTAELSESSRLTLMLSGPLKSKFMAEGTSK